MCGEARSCYWVLSWIIHLELDLELNDCAMLAGQWASSVPALGLQTWATHWLFTWVLWKLNSGPLHLHRKHATDWTISSQPCLFVHMFETGLHITQDGLTTAMLLRIMLSFSSSRLYFATTGMQVYINTLGFTGVTSMYNLKQNRPLC